MNELKYALRSLLRKPGYTFLVIGMLAIGITVSGTIFSLMNALLFRPLPAKDPDRLVRLYMRQDSRMARRISFPDYVDFRSKSGVFEDALATNLVALAVEANRVSQQTLGEVVSTNYFSVLEIQAIPGRAFQLDENSPSAVISYRLWQRIFKSDSQIVGKQIRLNGEIFTVIGVAPNHFSGTFAGALIDVWVPVTQVQWLGHEILTDRLKNEFHLIGRLKKEITPQQASAAVASLALQLEQTYPRSESKRTGAEVVPATLLHGNLRKSVSIFLAIMLAVSGLVLMTSIANVANLILISAAGKRREIALRFALGAGRFSIFRQFLIENLILTILAGIAGFILSIWCGALLQSFNPIPTAPIEFDLGPDPLVFAFLMGLSILMGFSLGLVPQLQFKTTSLLPALQSEPGRATSSRAISRYRSIFVVCQVAVSLILLIGAALFLQSLQHAEFMDPGFHPEKAMAVDLDLKLSKLNEEQGREFYKILVERVSHLPGVESAGYGDLAPLDIATARTAILVDGYQSAPGQPVFQISSNYISAGYFKTLGIPLVSGSDFTVANHKNSQLVAIINETMANRFWHGQTPLGKTFRLAGNNKLVTVNGVARDVKYRTIGEEPEPHLYLSVEQDYQSSLSLFVRTSSDPARFMETIQKEIRNIRPGIQGFFARTLEQHTSFAMLPARIAAWLSGIFAIIALILSVTGIYGTVGYSIAIQTKEIGIRIALGAEPSQILRWLISRGMILAGIGLVSGMLLALAGTKLLAKFLFRISPTDLPTFVVVLLVLAFATLVACYLPARRALQIDPAKAMRDA